MQIRLGDAVVFPDTMLVTKGTLIRIRVQLTFSLLRRTRHGKVCRLWKPLDGSGGLAVMILYSRTWDPSWSGLFGELHLGQIAAYTVDSRISTRSSRSTNMDLRELTEYGNLRQ